MIRVLICQSGTITDDKMQENYQRIQAVIGSDALEIYPFKDRKKSIAAIVRGDDYVSEYTDTWLIKNTEDRIYGPIIFVHAEPMESEYRSLTDEEIEWLRDNILLEEKGLAL